MTVLKCRLFPCAVEGCHWTGLHAAIHCVLPVLSQARGNIMGAGSSPQSPQSKATQSYTLTQYISQSAGQSPEPVSVRTYSTWCMVSGATGHDDVDNFLYG